MPERPELARALMPCVGALLALNALVLVRAQVQEVQDKPVAQRIEALAQPSPLSSKEFSIQRLCQKVGMVTCAPVVLPEISTTTTTLAVPEVVVATAPPKAISRPLAIEPGVQSPGLAEANPEELRYLDCIAHYESRGQANAYNPGGPYYGKYQFLQSTWDGFVTSINRSNLQGVDIRQVPEPEQDNVALQFKRSGRQKEWGPNKKCL